MHYRIGEKEEAKRRGMTASQWEIRDAEVRARIAHERKYGVSTHIQSYCTRCDQVRVLDFDLGISTHWTYYYTRRGRHEIKFHCEDDLEQWLAWQAEDREKRKCPLVIGG